MCIYIYTVVIAYKNIVGSREKCSYNRYVLITDTFLLRMDRNGSQAMVPRGPYSRYVLITYSRYVLITGVLITGTLLIQNYRKKIGYQEKWFL